MQEKLSWRTHEYFHTPKTADWYWIVGTITLSIALIAIILNNVIFAVLIIVSSFTLSLFASKRPDIIDIEINNSGVIVNRDLYGYKDLESFWIETEDGNPRIIIKSKKLFMPYISIFIEDVHPDDIHALLSAHLEEERHSEPLLEKLLIYLGF